MKIVVDHIPKCSSDCAFSRYLSCERNRCILTDKICVLDGDIPCECHRLILADSEQLKKYAFEMTKFKDYVTLEDIYEFFKHLSDERNK